MLLTGNQSIVSVLINLFSACNNGDNTVCSQKENYWPQGHTVRKYNHIMIHFCICIWKTTNWSELFIGRIQNEDVITLLLHQLVLVLVYSVHCTFYSVWLGLNARFIMLKGVFKLKRGVKWLFKLILLLHLDKPKTMSLFLPLSWLYCIVGPQLRFVFIID